MTEKGYHIREATTEDASGIAGLSAELSYPTDSDSVEKRLNLLLGDSHNRILVATDSESTLIGWIHVFIAIRVEWELFAEIGGLVITKSRRNRGVGKALLRAAESWAKRHSVQKVRVRSNVKRETSHGFYLHLGYEQVKNQAVYDKKLT